MTSRGRWVQAEIGHPLDSVMVGQIIAGPDVVGSVAVRRQDGRLDLFFSGWFEIDGPHGWVEYGDPPPALPVSEEPDR